MSFTFGGIAYLFMHLNENDGARFLSSFPYFSILCDTFTHRTAMYRQTEIEVPNESHSMVCNSW